MINQISNWTGNIVVAVIISTIIEMIIPEGNNKKYIKIVIGVFILFTIISPIINYLSDENFLQDTVMASTNIDKYKLNNTNGINTNNDIERVYVENLKQDIINRISEEGFEAKDVLVFVNMNDGNEFGKIQKIELKLLDKSNKVNDIEIVNINLDDDENITNTGNTITTKIQNKIKKLLAQTYGLSENQITIN